MPCAHGQSVCACFQSEDVDIVQKWFRITRATASHFLSAACSLSFSFSSQGSCLLFTVGKQVRAMKEWLKRIFTNCSRIWLQYLSDSIQSKLLVNGFTADITQHCLSHQFQKYNFCDFIILLDLKCRSVVEMQWKLSET